jgi:hypothetical protein
MKATSFTASVGARSWRLWLTKEVKAVGQKKESLEALKDDIGNHPVP